MASRIEARLRELKVALPEAVAPVANFVPCVLAGSLLFVSGQRWAARSRSKTPAPARAFAL